MTAASAPCPLLCLDCGWDVLAAPEVLADSPRGVVAGWVYGPCGCRHGRGRWVDVETMSAAERVQLALHLSDRDLTSRRT